MTAQEGESIRHMTDEEVYVREAVRYVDTVARRLEGLASRLRQAAERYVTLGASANEHVVRSGCVGVAAEVVNEYTQGVGSNGTYLWGVINSAREVDDYRRTARGDSP